MIKYTLKRIGIGAVSLYVLVTVSFFLTHLMPGSPFQGANVSADIMEEVEAEYGLNEPIYVQYGMYMRNLMQGDLGISFRKPGVSVAEVIGRAWPCTAVLGGLAVCTAGILGTWLGIWQASSRKRPVKNVIFLGAVLGSAVPNFVLALLLMLIFSVKLKWFPAAGILTPAHYVLPVLALSAYPAAVVTRLMAQSFSEELQKEYVVMAKARGISRRKIVWQHIMRHAWIPVFSYLGPASAFLITGSFVVESVFTIPGLGREFVNSISNRDYTMILGLTVFMGVVVILVNLVTDLLCIWLDPKIRRAAMKE